MCSINNQPLDFIMGLFSAWNICCVFPMLILVDHKKSPLSLLSNRRIPLCSQSPTIKFSRFQIACIPFPDALPTCHHLFWSANFRTGQCFHAFMLLCLEVNPGHGFCVRSGHCAQQHHTRSWQLSGYFPSPLPIFTAPLWHKEWCPFRRDLWPTLPAPRTLMKGHPWAGGRKWLPRSLDHLA